MANKRRSNLKPTLFSATSWWSASVTGWGREAPKFEGRRHGWRVWRYRYSLRRWCVFPAICVVMRWETKQSKFKCSYFWLMLPSALTRLHLEAVAGGHNWMGRKWVHCQSPTLDTPWRVCSQEKVWRGSTWSRDTHAVSATVRDNNTKRENRVRQVRTTSDNNKQPWMHATAKRKERHICSKGTG